MLGFIPLSSASLSSAGEKAVLASAAITGRAIVTCSAGFIEGSASVVGRATVAANANFLKVGVASINSSATVSAIGGYTRIGAASIASAGSLSVDAFVQQEQPISITSQAIVS